jgi:hypothetical protein
MISADQVWRSVFRAGAFLVITGCAGRAAPPVSPSPSCALGDRGMIRETLYFGRNRPGGGFVGETEWQDFLGQVITPRFPLGLTVVAAKGQWKGKSGSIEQEQSEIVTLFHSGDEAARRAISEVATEYKRRFQQEAVLRERMPTCTRFE